MLPVSVASHIKTLWQLEHSILPLLSSRPMQLLPWLLLAAASTKG